MAKRKSELSQQPIQSKQNKPLKFTDPTDLLNNLRIDVKGRTENQKLFIDLIKNKEVIICSGAPGSGKTFLACAEALRLLKTDPIYKKIVLIKSVTTLKSEEIGYIKGSIENKLQPVMYSFINNFEKIIGEYNVEKLKEFGLLQELPISYLRGINIDSSLVLIDESQNISIENIRTILTRLGSNSKMILLGDVNQIDNKDKKNNSLDFLTKYFNNIDEVGVIKFTVDDIIRNKLIKKFEEVFNSFENEKEIKPRILKPIDKPKKENKLIKWFKNLL